MQAAPFSPSRHDGDGVNAEVLRQLELDLPRTAGTDVALHGCIGRVRTMILQHLEDDPELGYCQGMTLVAAVFAAAHNDAEVEAYRRFAAFVQRVRGLWLPGFPLLQPSIASFEALAKGRPWFMHLVWCTNRDVFTSGLTLDAGHPAPLEKPSALLAVS